MAGIYIHIPFCKKACHYCNFHFSTSPSLKNEFIDALLKEVEITSSVRPWHREKNYEGPYLGSDPIETIYFGGGTPSLLSGEELNIILHKVQEHFIIVDGAEITLEANPDDITLPALREWSRTGINRLSIGVQSFYDDDLLWMNRAHDREQALSSILMAQQEGFHNISIDLIFGTPSLTNEKLKYNVDKAIALGLPHLSCYALTVEPSTALAQMIKQKKSPGIDPDKQADQFLLLTEWLEKAGYEHYEISNFAKPGMRSRHNSSYWQGKPYLGLGPSAHSFNGSSREWNVANNALYIQSLKNEIRASEAEYLTDNQKLNEFIMISLRTAEGINLILAADKFGEEAVRHIKNAVNKHIGAGHVKEDEGMLQLTREGKLYADGIAADLFK